MKYPTILVVGLVAAALAATGCDNKDTGSKPPSKPGASKNDDHAHGKGPNDGVVFDLGKYHAEFTVDHKAKECKVVILGNDEKTPKPIDAKELTVTTKETKTKDGTKVAPMTIKLTPKDAKDGKATTYIGTDPSLGNVADFEGTVIADIDGKPAQGTFKEE